MGAVDLMPVEQFAISVMPHGSRVVVTPFGEIDLASAENVAEAVREMKDAGFAEVVLDLRGVTFMDSVGLCTLLAAREDAANAGCRLELVPGREAVQRVFELTDTLRVFTWR